MAKVTSKLQVTVPKVIAVRYGIRPGDDIEWIPSGDGIRVKKVAEPPRTSDTSEIARRLELFDLATKRQRERGESRPRPAGGARGWRREDVYDRGSSC